MINKNNHTLIPVLKNYIFAGEPFVDWHESIEFGLCVDLYRLIQVNLNYVTTVQLDALSLSDDLWELGRLGSLLDISCR